MAGNKNSVGAKQGGGRLIIYVMGGHCDHSSRAP